MSSSSNFKFLCFYTALVVAATSLLFYALITPSFYKPLEELLIPILLAQSFSYLLIGVGIGIPVCLLSIIFSWIYAILTITQIVEPHLTGKGFFEALKSLTHGLEVLINKMFQ